MPDPGDEYGLSDPYGPQDPYGLADPSGQGDLFTSYGQPQQYGYPQESSAPSWMVNPDDFSPWMGEFRNMGGRTVQDMYAEADAQRQQQVQYAPEAPQQQLLDPSHFITWDQYQGMLEGRLPAHEAYDKYINILAPSQLSQMGYSPEEIDQARQNFVKLNPPPPRDLGWFGNLEESLFSGERSGRRAIGAAASGATSDLYALAASSAEQAGETPVGPRVAFDQARRQHDGSTWGAAKQFFSAIASNPEGALNETVYQTAQAWPVMAAGLAGLVTPVPGAAPGATAITSFALDDGATLMSEVIDLAHKKGININDSAAVVNMLRDPAAYKELTNAAAAHGFGTATVDAATAAITMGIGKAAAGLLRAGKPLRAGGVALSGLGAGVVGGGLSEVAGTGLQGRPQDINDIAAEAFLGLGPDVAFETAGFIKGLMPGETAAPSGDIDENDLPGGNLQEPGEFIGPPERLVGPPLPEFVGPYERPGGPFTGPPEPPGPRPGDPDFTGPVQPTIPPQKPGGANFVGPLAPGSGGATGIDVQEGTEDIDIRAPAGPPQFEDIERQTGESINIGLPPGVSPDEEINIGLPPGQMTLAESTNVLGNVPAGQGPRSVLANRVGGVPGYDVTDVSTTDVEEIDITTPGPARRVNLANFLDTVEQRLQGALPRLTGPESARPGFMGPPDQRNPQTLVNQRQRGEQANVDAAAAAARGQEDARIAYLTTAQPVDLDTQLHVENLVAWMRDRGVSLPAVNEDSIKKNPRLQIVADLIGTPPNYRQTFIANVVDELMGSSSRRNTALAEALIALSRSLPKERITPQQARARLEADLPGIPPDKIPEVVADALAREVVEAAIKQSRKKGAVDPNAFMAAVDKVQPYIRIGAIKVDDIKAILRDAETTVDAIEALADLTTQAYEAIHGTAYPNDPRSPNNVRQFFGLRNAGSRAGGRTRRGNAGGSVAGAAGGAGSPQGRSGGGLRSGKSAQGAGGGGDRNAGTGGKGGTGAGGQAGAAGKPNRATGVAGIRGLKNAQQAATLTGEAANMDDALPQTDRTDRIGIQSAVNDLRNAAPGKDLTEKEAAPAVQRDEVSEFAAESTEPGELGSALLMSREEITRLSEEAAARSVEETVERREAANARMSPEVRLRYAALTMDEAQFNRIYGDVADYQTVLGQLVRPAGTVVKGRKLRKKKGLRNEKQGPTPTEVKGEAYGGGRQRDVANELAGAETPDLKKSGRLYRNALKNARDKTGPQGSKSVAGAPTGERMSPSLARQIQMSPLASVLDYLRNTLASPLERMLAERLQQIGIDVPIQLGPLPGRERGRYTFNTLPGQSTQASITMDPTKASGSDVLHEVAHAATVKELRSPSSEQSRKAGQRMQQLFEYAKSQANEYMYGLEDVEEFVAAAFGDAKFQAFLHSLKLPNAPKITAWTAFKTLVMQMLGTRSVLSETLMEAESLFSAVQPNDRGSLSVTDNKPLADQSRRNFLKQLGALAASAMTPNIVRAAATPAFRSVVTRDGATVQEALQHIIANEPKLARTATKVLAALGDRPFPISYYPNAPRGMSYAIRGQVSQNPKTKEMTLGIYDADDPVSSGVNPYTVLHEAIHAAVFERGHNLGAVFPGALGEELARIRGRIAKNYYALPESVRKELDAKFKKDKFIITAPLGDTDEFLAYALTSKPFQDWLRTMPATNASSLANNLLDEIKNWFMRLLGMDPSDAAMRSAFDDATDASNAIIDDLTSRKSAESKYVESRGSSMRRKMSKLGARDETTNWTAFDRMAEMGGTLKDTTTQTSPSDAKANRVPRDAIVGTKNGVRTFIAYAKDRGDPNTKYTLYPVTDEFYRGDASGKVKGLTRAQAEKHIRGMGSEVVAPASDTSVAKGTPKNSTTRRVGFDADGNLRAIAFEQKDGTWTYYESDDDVRTDPDSRVMKGLSASTAQRYITGHGYSATPPVGGAVKAAGGKPTPVEYDSVGWFRRWVQDQEAATANIGGGVDTAAVLRNSRFQKKWRDTQRQYIQPLAKVGADIQTRFGKSEDEIWDLMQALHVIERMKTKQAQFYRGSLPQKSMQQKQAELRQKQQDAEDTVRKARGANPSYVTAVEKELAPKVKAMADNNIDMAVTYGHLARDEAEEIKRAYDFYVPLQHGDKTTLGKAATGAAVTGDLTFPRLIEQTKRTIARGEQNRVRQEVYKIAKNLTVVYNRGKADERKENPVIIGPQKKVVYSRENNSLDEGEDSFIFDPNSVDVYIGGERIRMKITDESLLEALHPYKGEQRKTAVTVALATLANVNRLVSMGKTSLNPAWPPFNFVRDILTSNINLPKGVDRGKYWLELAKLSNYGAVLANVTKEALGKVPTGIYADAQDAGAFISHRAFIGLDPIAKDTAAMFKPSKLQKAKEFASFDGGLFELLSIPAQLAESVPRMAMYKAALASGMSKEQAAMAAKNASVNFEKRGSLGLSNYWIFGNAKMQGVHALAKSAKQMGTLNASLGALAIVSIGAFAAAVGYQWSEKDKDGKSKYAKIPDQKKDSMFLLKADGYGIPIPQEVAPLYVLGNAVVEAAMGGVSSGKAAARFFTSAANNIWPGSIAQQDPYGHKADALDFMTRMLVPSQAMPLYESVTNKNTWGQEIISGKENKKEQGIPNSEMGSPNENQLAVNVARGLANATGGAVDVAPQMLKLWNNYFNPLAEGYAAARDIFAGREERYVGDEVNPFARKFKGNATEFADQDEFESLLAQAKRAQYKIDPKNPQRVTLDKLSPEERVLASQAPMLKKVDSDASNLFKGYQLMPPERRKLLNERKRDLVLGGIRRYNEARDRMVPK